MKKIQMESQIKEDLKHIPRGSTNSPQNYLRLYYNSMRRVDLSQDISIPKSFTLRRVVEQLRKSHPEFVPSFDQEYFDISVSAI